MQAIVIDGYGGSERLRLADQPEPTPGAGEVLLRVRAAAVNPVDWKIREGQLRFVLPIRFPYIPGGDVAGEVLSVGANVTRFTPGDRVVGFVNPWRGGGYAERAPVRESAAAALPHSLSFVEAATLPIAGVTALQAIRDSGRLTDGGSILIIGAAGGVGHFAVQIAKVLSATTAATCGPANIAFVQSLGADLVIDYAKEDFAQRAEQYDVVFDAAAARSFSQCKAVLKPGGAYVSTLPSPALVVQGALQSVSGLFARTKQAKFVVVRPAGTDLAFLGALAHGGRLRPIVTQTLPLARAKEAQDLIRGGHTRGKIVLEV
jgi:NADPH:quinone reductase-like Zn-dependent oxidoreductase